MCMYLELKGEDYNSQCERGSGESRLNSPFGVTSIPDRPTPGVHIPEGHLTLPDYKPLLVSRASEQRKKVSLALTYMT